jgi:hypothetical protein
MRTPHTGCARLDDDVWQAIVSEATLMGDVDQLVTIRRRLTYGAWVAPIVDRRESAWRAIREDAQIFEFELDGPVLTELQLFAEKYSFGLEVVIATILTSDAYKPPEVASAERAVAPGRGRSLRWEPGRGHIYPVRFELPGYQLVFLKLLSPSVVKRDEMLEEALLALARQVQHVDRVAGVAVSDEARAFARKMAHWPSR